MKKENSNLPSNPNLEITFNKDNLKEIYYAGGCFWGVEAYLSRIPGVYDATVGYANGNTEKPTYEEVCRKQTGHAEAVHVTYDPEIISLKALTEQFFTVINPTSLNKQGNDQGSQYRSGVYYVNKLDKEIIEGVISEEQKKHEKAIVTEVSPLSNYYLAEGYHQDYLDKNPSGYCHISFDGLEAFAKAGEISVDPTKYSRPTNEELQSKLTEMEYDVTQNSATERPFTGEHNDNFKRGIYVDIVTGEPMFVSTQKFNSGCGWPSFSKPIDENVIIEKADNSRGRSRVEVRSRVGDSHLGHVFTDGPKEGGGLRYCINSAAITFVPYDEMEAKGYGEFMPLVDAEA